MMGREDLYWATLGEMLAHAASSLDAGVPPRSAAIRRDPPTTPRHPETAG
ncbi:MAG: hypothetical protein KGR69_10430 [Verrucomicrobia bacterium]|nr:hypothetical protein [Verrucomicrobiota bacterium]